MATPAPGMFNFQQVMNEFYNYKPKDDDAYGNAMKNSFQANMVQSAWDTNMAKDMAQTQAGLSSGAMTQAADLELRNKTALMQQEFNYGMQSMGAQYGYQSEFADNQVDRDITTMGAAGEQERKSIGATGQENRLLSITSGEQERLSDTNRLSVAGKETRQTDTNRILTQGSQDRDLTRVSGEEQRATDTNKLRVGGDETRTTMTHGQQLEAKTRAEQHGRSMTAARAF